MLSRVADSVFWMARYMERSNGMLRIIRTNYISSQDEVQDFTWLPLLRGYSDAPDEVLEPMGKDSPSALEHILFDRDNEASVYNNITRARENARAVQDHITKEVWQCLNQYYHLVRDQSLHAQVKQGDPVTALDALIQQGMLYHGIVDITMARGEGFNYLNIGKYLERAILCTNMLNIKLSEVNFNLQQPVEVTALRYLLYSLSGYELYMKTHRGNFQSENVLHQLLYSDHFPHSVSYCLKQLVRYFERLKTESLPDSYKSLEFLLGRSLTGLQYSNIDFSRGDEVHRLLRQMQDGLFSIAGGFNKHYFGHS